MSDLPENSTPPEAPPAPPGWSQRAKLLAGVGALVVAAGTGVAFSGALGGDDDPSPAAAAASSVDAPDGEQQRARGQGGTFGTITEVSDDGFTLTTDGAAETVEVALSADTTITDTTSGTVDDLQAGDNVRILGQSDESGSVTARQIIDSADDADLLSGGGFGPGSGGEMPQPPDGMTPPEDGQAPEGMPPGGGFSGGTTGTIESIDGDTLTVTTEDGETVTVTLTEDTNVRLVRAIDLGDLEVDDPVSVRGETGDGVLTATTVQRGDAAFGPGGGDRGRPPSDSGDDSTDEDAAT